MFINNRNQMPNRNKPPFLTAPTLILIALLIILALEACGQKGPLRMPQENNTSLM
jgi:hypothetical protein